MWNKLYWWFYFLFNRRPTSQEIQAEFDRLEGQSQVEGLPSSGGRCDCVIFSGGEEVDCYPNVRKVDCQLVGDTEKGRNGIEYPLGYCRSGRK